MQIQKLMPIKEALIMKNKKGQATGLNMAIGVLIILVTFVLIFGAGLYGLVTFRDIGLFDVGTPEATFFNNTVTNYSIAGSTFMGNATSIMSIVLLVVILTLLGFAIFAIYRFAGVSGGGSAGL